MPLTENFWKKNNLPPPPECFDCSFLDWIGFAQDELDVAFLDGEPLPDSDLQKLTQSVGKPPDEIAFFYKYTTPWWNMKNGFDIWREHMEIALNRLKQTPQKRGENGVKKADLALQNASEIWPVNLSQYSTAIALADDRKRLIILNGNIGSEFGCPLATSLRNYLIMLVAAEIRLEEKPYKTCELTLQDPIVRTAAGWFDNNSSAHIFAETHAKKQQYPS